MISILLKKKMYQISGICDFEADLCDWTQEQNADQFDWKRDRNGTRSTGTGPTYDHTTESENGN